MPNYVQTQIKQKRKGCSAVMSNSLDCSINCYFNSQLLTFSLSSNSDHKVWWTGNSVWKHRESYLWWSHKLRKVLPLTLAAFALSVAKCTIVSLCMVVVFSCNLLVNVHLRSANGATSIFYGPLMMLKAACMHNPSYIDRYDSNKWDSKGVLFWDGNTQNRR